MLDELASVLETMEFENDGSMSLAGSEHDAHRLTLLLRVRTGAEDEPLQTWRVECSGVEAFALSSDLAYGIDVTDDDPALWEYAAPKAYLYCHDVAPSNASALLGDLYRAHVAAVGEAIDVVPFGRWLNADAAFTFGAGIVAYGPVPLLRAYQAALTAEGVALTFDGGGGLPGRWNGTSWVERAEPLHLLTFGASWVVAAAFQATRAT